jgi:hypothetical protein
MRVGIGGSKCINKKFVIAFNICELLEYKNINKRELMWDFIKRKQHFLVLSLIICLIIFWNIIVD